MHFFRKNTFLIVGGVVTAALLAACGGGGGATTASPHVAPSAALPTGSTPTSGTRITFTIPAKSKHAQQKNGRSQARAAVAAKRTPTFVSGSTLGMQISVTSGTTTHTVYADTSAGGGNCTTADPNTGAQTCSVIVPTAGTTETIAVTTVDQPPTGDANGYGTGFPANANVLGIGSSNINATIGGITNASVTVMLVFTGYNEGGASGNSAAALYVDGGYVYPNITNPVTRFVVQAGTANRWNVISAETDADNNYQASYPTTSTLIDVNGSPAPISLTSSSTGLTLSTYAGSNTGNPPSTPSGTITIPDTSYFSADSFLVIGVTYDGMAAPGSTITYSNGLTALNPYSGVSQTVAAQYVLAPITVTSGTTATVTQNQTTTVTVSDWGATSGLYPVDNLGVVATSGSANCYNSNALLTGVHDVVATITPGALPTGPPWTQSFTVTGANTSGPCTFSLVDAISYNAGSSVSSQTISLEVLGT